VFDALPNRAISVSCDQTVAAHHAITRQEARNSHYVLSAASQYEKWEYTLFILEFPTNYFHLRAPLFETLPAAFRKLRSIRDYSSRWADLPQEQELGIAADGPGNRKDITRAGRTQRQ
jgi:hypothetical protein